MDARAKWAEVRATDEGSVVLGPNTSDRYLGDPKRISFMLARYTVAGKLMFNCQNILEVGMGDGFGSCVLLNETRAQILGIDFDEELVAYFYKELKPSLANNRPYDARRINEQHGDFLKSDGFHGFDGFLSLDCIEHILPTQMDDFIERAYGSLGDSGIAIIGTPNAKAAHLGSVHSQIGHLNNLNPQDLRLALQKKFRHTFMFGINDCVLHMGHPDLWHYIIGMAVK